MVNMHCEQRRGFQVSANPAPRCVRKAALQQVLSKWDCLISGRCSGRAGINFYGSDGDFGTTATTRRNAADPMKERAACLAGYGKSPPVAGNDRFASGRQNPEIIVETDESPVVEPGVHRGRDRPMILNVEERPELHAAKLA